MKHIVTEQVTVTYEVDIPDDEELAELGLTQEEYVCSNQPPREEWQESVNDRDIEPAEEESE